MNAFYDIDYNIIRDILVKAHNIAQNKTYLGSNKSSQIDLLSILEAYSVVLGNKSINASKDTDYYKFLLDLSVETNKSKQNDWWAAFEKLRVKYQRRKIAFRFYTRNLYQKVLVGFLKQRFMSSVYDQDKLKEASKRDYMSVPVSSQPQSKVGTTHNERFSQKHKIEASYRSEINRSDTLLHRTLLSFTPPKNFTTDLTRSDSKEFSRDPEKSRSTKKDFINSNSKQAHSSKSPSPSTRRKTPTKTQSSHKNLKIKTANENAAKTLKEQKPPAGLSKNASKKTLIIGVKSPTEPAITPKQTPLNFEKSPTIQLNTSATKSPLTADKENSFTPFLGRTVAMVNEFSEHTTRKNAKKTLEMNIDASKSFESFARKETSTQIENIFTTYEDPNLTHITNNYKTDASAKKDYSKFFSEFSMKNLTTTEQRAMITEPSFTKDEISCFDKTYDDPEKEEDFKIMSRVFTRWSIYARKHKKKKDAKNKLIHDTVKAMELNYRNIITKAFVSWGTVMIVNKKLAKKYEVIRGKYDNKLIRNAMDRYLTAFRINQKEKMIQRKATRFCTQTLLKKKFSVWKHVSEVRMRKIKPFQVPWQPKLLIELIANSFNISMRKGYHSVIGKIPQHIKMPPSREWRVLDAITLLNSHLLQNGFSNWKVYTKKCLEIRSYYEQISKRKTYLFWKHYAMKKRSLRTKEESVLAARNNYFLQKGWLSLKKFANKRKILAKKQRALKFEHERKLRVHYFSFWNSLATNIEKERQLEFLSGKCHKENLIWKAFRGLKRVFDEKMIKLNKKHTVNSYVTSKVLYSIFFAWKAWSSKRALLKLRNTKLSFKKTKQTLKSHFLGWRSELKATLKVQAFRASVLKKRAMNGFIRYYFHQKANEEVADAFNYELEQRHFTNIFNEFVTVTIKRSAYKKVLLINQEKRYFELMNIAFASLYGYMINKVKLRRRLSEYTAIKSKRTKAKVLQNWGEFVQKNYNLQYLHSHFSAIRDSHAKGRFMKKWINQYRASVEDREYEEHYIEQANSKTKSAVFGYLKKFYEKTNQKAIISSDFFTLTTLSKSFHALDEYLYNKRKERKVITDFRRKFNVILVKKILASVREITLKNESKRKIRNRALNHCLTSRITRIFDELRKYAVQSAKDKRVTRKLNYKRSSYLFDRWREEYKLSVVKKSMKKKIYARAGIAFFNYMAYKKAQDQRVREYKKKHYIKKARVYFGELVNYFLLKKKKSNLSVLAKKIECWRKAKIMASWKEEYNKVIQFNDIAQVFVSKKEDNIKRLFLDLLAIKRQKKILRSMLLEKFKQTSKDIYLRKWFNLFAEAVFTVKTMHKAQADYTIKKENSVIHKYFSHMKEYLHTQRQMTERALSYSQRSTTNRKHEILESWRNYAEKKREQKFRATQIKKNVQSNMLEKYFERIKHEYDVRAKSALISERFGKTNESLQLSKCLNAWSEYLKVHRRKKNRTDLAHRFRQYQLKKWVVDSMSSFNKTSRLNKYQESLASQFYLQKIYEKFVASICQSLKRRHQKVTAMKHYAYTLTSKSMHQIKQFTKNKFMFRYKKIMETIEEERPLSAQSKSSKKSYSNLDAPFSDNQFILREKDVNI